MTARTVSVPHGLMFHRFHADDETVASQGSVGAADLSRIIEHVGPSRVLPPDEWMARLDAGALGPADTCITFDDGLRSQMDVALPVLEQFGIRAFWFVYSSIFDGRPVKGEVYSHVAGRSENLFDECLDRCPPVLRRLLESAAFAEYADRMRTAVPFYSTTDVQYRFLRNAEQVRDEFEALMDQLIAERGFDTEALVRELWLTEADLRTLVGRGHAVGLHSYDHPHDLGALSRAAQRDQYERNYTQLTRATGRRPSCMSHPLNSYNEDSLEILRELDIRCGFRANLLPPAGKPLNPSRLELAREDSTHLLPVDSTQEAR